MATDRKTIDSTWQEVAVGACYIQNQSNNQIYVHFGLMLPAQDSSNIVDWSFGELEYNGDENVYLRTTGDATSTVVVVTL